MNQGYVQAWWGTWWPWAEANAGLLSAAQGFLAVAALIFAFWAFAKETRRANEAEQAGREQVARQEARDRQRDREALEREGFLARRAEQERLAGYVRVCSKIIEGVESDLRAEHDSIAALMARVGASVSTGFWNAPEGMQAGLVGLADSLTALLPSCPPDAELILATQQAANAARQAGNRTLSFSMAGATDWLNRVSSKLEECRIALNARALALITGVGVDVPTDHDD